MHSIVIGLKKKVKPGLSTWKGAALKMQSAQSNPRVFAIRLKEFPKTPKISREAVK